MNRDQELGKENLDNVVSFPFGNSPRPQASSIVSPLDLNDPLEELLNEFADLEIEDDEWEPVSTFKDEEINALFVQTPNQQQDELELLVHQVSLLEDVTKRMKFYLDEIELFTPYLRK